MRIFAVLAHFNPEALDSYLFNKLVEHYKALGHELDVLDLYHHAHEIPFYYENRDRKNKFSFLEENTFYRHNRERLLAADRLVIVYPIYWYSVPGILKCWMDLITNFFWHYTPGNLRAQGLHHIPKAFIVNTSSAPRFILRFLFNNTASAQVRHTLQWMGIPSVYFYEIGSVYSLTPAKIEHHVRRMLIKSNALL